MFYVPLYIELLRSRPHWMFWFAALVQAFIWLVVPVVFYFAPPGDLAQLLAIGHEFRFDGGVGPPLAYWLGEIAFRFGGLFAVYLLAQVCIVVAYWSVFALGRAIIGPEHAAIAVLLMVGIALLTVPSPDFGPAILTMVLWSVALLHYWQAVAQGNKRSWYVFGGAAALILLSTEAALVLLGTLALFTALTERGRAALEATEPWIVGVVLSFFLFLHLIWLDGVGHGFAPILEGLRQASAAGGNTVAWLRLLIALALAHAGLVILVVLAGRCFCRNLRQGLDADTGARRYHHRGANQTFDPDRRRGPSRATCRPLHCDGGGRQHRALSPARARLRLGGSLGRAGGFRTVVDRRLAVGCRNRSENRAAGEGDGPLLRRKFRTAYRTASGDRHRRCAYRGAGRACGAEPA